MAFDPDTYLMEKTGETATDSGDFDPDKYLAEKEVAPEPTPEPAKPERAGLGGYLADIGDAFTRQDPAAKAEDAKPDAYPGQSVVHFANQAMEVPGAVIGAVNKPFVPAEKWLAKNVIEGAAFAGGYKGKGDASGITQLAAPAIGAVAQQAEKHPILTDIARTGINVASLGIGKGALKVGKQVAGDAGKVVGIGLSAEEKYAKALKPGISKGIKPTVVGKKSLARHDKFYTDADQALRTIAENKNAISVVDSEGLPVSHPKTAAQAAQAIDQAKKIVYKKYNDMAVAAGDAGASFKSNKVLSRLDEIAQAPDEVIPKNDPRLKWDESIRRYAHDMKASVAELDGASPEIIEARIKDLNNSLKGYYEGRTAAAKAQIDGSVAQAMREELDANITSAVGDGYQALKNQYGALKSIEKEVNHRAIVNARKNTAGLTDLTDVFTGGELVAGVMTANPALIAKAFAGREIKEHIKKFNDPDLYVERMFKRAYGLPEAVSGSTVADFASHGVADVKGLQSPTFARKGIDMENEIAANQRGTLPTSEDPFAGMDVMTKKQLDEIARADAAFTPETDLPMDALKNDPRYSYEQMNMLDEASTAAESAAEKSAGQLSISASKALGREVFGGQVPLTLTDAKREALERIAEASNTMFESNPAQWYAEYGAKGFPARADVNADDLFHMISAPGDASATAGRKVSNIVDKRLSDQVKPGQSVADFVAESQKKGATPAGKKTGTMADRLREIGKNAANRIGNERGAVGGASQQIHSEPFKKWFGDWQKSPETASKVVDAEGKPLVVYHGTNKDFNIFEDTELGKNTSAASADLGHFFTSSPTNANRYLEMPYKSASMKSGVYDSYEKMNDEINRLGNEFVDKYKSQKLIGKFSFSDMLSRLGAYDYNISRFLASDNSEVATLKKIINDSSAKKEFTSLVEKIKGRREISSIANIPVASGEDADKLVRMPNVKAVHLNIKNPLIKDYEGELYRDETFYDLLKQAKTDGHDGAIFRNVRDPEYNDVYVVFSPNQIKSATGNSGAFSAANPDIRGSGAVPMMAGMAAAGIGGATAYHVFMKKREQARNKKK